MIVNAFGLMMNVLEKFVFKKCVAGNFFIEDCS